MSGRGWGWLSAWLVMATLTGARPAEAQGPAQDQASDETAEDELTELRREVFELSLGLMRAEALAEELRFEATLLAPGPAPAAPDARPRSATQALWELAFDRTPAVGPQLPAVLQAARKDEAAAVGAWRDAVGRALAFRDELSAAEARVGRSWATPQRGGGWGPAWGPLALGALSVAGGVLLTLHEARDRLRWRLRALGSRPSLVVLALALALASGDGCAGGIDDANAATADDDQGAAPAGDAAERRRQEIAGLTRRCDELRQQLATAEQANAADADRLRRRLEEVRRDRATHALRPSSLAQKRMADRALAASEEQEQFRAIRSSARTTARVAADAERLDQEVARDRARLARFVAGHRNTARRDGLVRVAACAATALAVVVPLAHVRSKRRRQREQESRKCPRCLAKDTLMIEAGAAADAADDRQPKARLAVCSDCEYEIRESYIRQSRLCFPTVGITFSGKTHWLVTLYDQIKNSNVPIASAIKKIPSREDARFDQLVRDVLYSRVHPDPTTLSRESLPYPLTFHVNDADPLGANRTLVNLFDFSGELRHFTIDRDEFRRRALLCEGFTLFLDPTQLIAGRPKLSIEDQIQTLAQFAEEMHAIRGIPSERPIDLPIAICVSKIDLLVTQNPIGTQALTLVAALRETMGRTPDLALIQERSRLCAARMPQMFPGWNVERKLRESFGGRYMFFPISSVGLEEAELGVEDLSGRMIAPFGVLEPLLWLLHMHGYCVLR